jgi:hypothetical protein
MVNQTVPSVTKSPNSLVSTPPISISSKSASNQSINSLISVKTEQVILKNETKTVTHPTEFVERNVTEDSKESLVDKLSN